MRRTLEQRQQHEEFAEQALRTGQPPARIVVLLKQSFGLTPRQARCDMQHVLEEIKAEGDAVRRGQRQAEDLCLTLRRYERIYRDALEKDDRRTALKVEKARCRLLGLYAPARQTPPELAANQAEAECVQADDENRALSRRRLRQVGEADKAVAETSSFPCSAWEQSSSTLCVPGPAVDAERHEQVTAEQQPGCASSFPCSASEQTSSTLCVAGPAVDAERHENSSHAERAHINPLDELDALYREAENFVFDPGLPASLNYDASCRMAPPLNDGHIPNCECWMCNPLYQAQHDRERRRQFPAWIRQQHSIRSHLAPTSQRWLGRQDHETEEEFRARVHRVAGDEQRRYELSFGLSPGLKLSPAAEERLAVLTRWLELGVARDICRRRYQARFKPSPRRLRAEWELCLARFDAEGRYLLRRRNEDLALGVALRRRELLVEQCWEAGDYKLALDIEIDRSRLIGLHPRERKHLPPPPPPPPSYTDRAALDLLDRLDPTGRGTGLPTPSEQKLVRRLN